MLNPIAALIRKVEELDRRMTNMVRIGKVKETDPSKDRVKVEDGTGWETDMLPAASARHGGVKKRTTYAVGEQVIVLSPSGEYEQGIVMPAGFWTSDNAQPSTEGEEDMTVIGTAADTHRSGYREIKVDESTKITMTAGKIEFLVGGATYTFTADKMTADVDNVQFNGSSVKHNVKEIGDKHKHLDVFKGPDLTGVPE